MQPLNTLLLYMTVAQWFYKFRSARKNHDEEIDAWCGRVASM